MHACYNEFRAAAVRFCPIILPDVVLDVSSYLTLTFGDARAVGFLAKGVTKQVSNARTSSNEALARQLFAKVDTDGSGEIEELEIEALSVSHLIFAAVAAPSA